MKIEDYSEKYLYCLNTTSKLIQIETENKNKNKE
jgi:hypothetical protein